MDHSEKNILTDRTMRRTGDGGTRWTHECVRLHACLCLCVDGNRCVRCVFVAAPAPVNPHLNVSLPLIPGFLQGGPGSWQKNAWEWAPSIKATLCSGPRDGPGLYFSSFPSPASLNPSGPLLLLLLLLRFKRNGFTLRLRERETQRKGGVQS